MREKVGGNVSASCSVLFHSGLSVLTSIADALINRDIDALALFHFIMVVA